MDWHALEKMKVTELRELAKEKTSLEGVSGMHKDHLVEEMAKALGIPKPHKVAHGQEKSQIKKQIKAMKAKRKEIQGSGDKTQLSALRNQLHHLKRKIRRHAEMTV